MDAIQHDLIGMLPGNDEQSIGAILVETGRLTAADAQVVARLGAAADHPVALNFPEGDYLKGLICRVGG